jgi:hydroxymethylpyrimidine pyrophosphatase-like HAD family hydrolase
MKNNEDFKYKVFFNGELIHQISKNRIIEKNINDYELEDIKDAYIKEHLLALRLKNTYDIEKVDEIVKKHFILFKRFQQLYHYNLNINYYRFWELPKCSCPKLENIKLIGENKRIISPQCVLHRNFNFE